MANAHGLKMTGKSYECTSCDLVEYQKSIVKSTASTRSLVPNWRGFKDLAGPIIVFDEKENPVKVMLLVNVEDSVRFGYASTVIGKSAGKVATVVHQLLVEEINPYGGMKVIRLDQGKEWWNAQVLKVLHALGIRVEGTGPATPLY